MTVLATVSVGGVLFGAVGLLLVAWAVISCAEVILSDLRWRRQRRKMRTYRRVVAILPRLRRYPNRRTP